MARTKPAAIIETIDIVIRTYVSEKLTVILLSWKINPRIRIIPARMRGFFMGRRLQMRTNLKFKI